MKTTAWTPSPSLNTADFCVDEEVIFYATTTKITKRVSLMGALLAAGAFASANLPFEIRNKGHEVLVVFEPGEPVRGYPTIIQALVEVAGHLDNHAKNAVFRAVEKLKPELFKAYEEGAIQGVLLERALWLQGQAEAQAQAAATGAAVPGAVDAAERAATVDVAAAAPSGESAPEPKAE